MPTAIFANNKSTLRVVLGISVCLGLILLALISFPIRSGAKLQTSTTAAPVTKAKRTRQPFVPGDVLVRYRSESMAQARAGSRLVATKEGRALAVRVDPFSGSELVPGLRLARVDASETLNAVAALRNDPDVLYAEPNYILRAAATPNDTQFLAGRQTNLTKVGLQQAWDTNTGSRAVVIAILDQGIDTAHEDLLANIWTNPGEIPGNGIDDDNNTKIDDIHGYNFDGNTGTVFSGVDTEFHATHVAGIAGAVGNNGIGVAGVNWAVSLMSLKFLDADGFGNTVNAIAACDYAKKMRDLWDTAPVHTKGANIKVINASFGEKSFTKAFLDVINALNSTPGREILFVAAAGNIDDGTREPNNDLVPEYPANFSAPNVISVASVNASDSLSTSFTHFGATTVDLAAPGENILSTTPPCSNPGPFPKPCQPSFPANPTPTQDTYTFVSGTSMSAPHVSGAAALLWAQNPNLTMAQVKNLLLLNGDVQPSLVDKTLTGRRLNVGTSFLSLSEGDATAPGAVNNLHINSQIGRTLNLGWTASGDDGANGQASLYEVSFVDGNNSAVIPLKGVLPIASGSGQIASITVPFRHTNGSLRVRSLDNVGNETISTSLPIGIPLSIADPYTSSVGSVVALSAGGTDIGIHADDSYSGDFLFPGTFTFPFFGTTFTSVIVSTNGALYFTTPPSRANGEADDVPSSPGALGGLKMIAGLWDDLDLRISSRADAGVFVVQPSATRLIFRWQGVPCNFDGNVCTGGTPVNFEIELQSNGVIKTRYGSGNTGLFPTVGIGGGEQDGYVIDSYTSEEMPKDLTNFAEVTFTPRTQTVSSIQLSQPTFSVTEGTPTLTVGVTRTGDTTSVASVDFATSDAVGAALCNVNNGNASSRCDYSTTVGTLILLAGETSKTINIPIEDDVYAEGPENFTLTLSNPVGATLGAPSTATLTINDNETVTGTNPIDTASFFVHQHYVDFLNREPDASGLAFWTNQITSCGADAGCTEVKRINVSAAFFLSIEFQETGYLVYRIYKSAFGNLPGAPVPVRFTDFLKDTQQIGQGVVVGQGNWEAQLEANKQAFVLAFVQRPDFQAAFPNSMTAQQFVDQLDSRAGNVLTAGEKTPLLGVLGVTPSDLSRRASVLRSVAEDKTLRDAEFNKAFVLMQYFGYLRRNPNDTPDTDFGGLNFWLGKLNQFNGNFVDAEMVKSFLVSGEYRQRFGP